MPATRSSRSAASLISSSFAAAKPSSRAVKPAKAPVESSPLLVQPPEPLPVFLPGPPPDLIPAADLNFDFVTARDHLIAADARFARVFEKIQCRPFEVLDDVNPFRSLVTSIIGQQVSWLAARAINHRFRRLFDPSLPEKADERTEKGDLAKSFPSPADILRLSVEQLKTAGLSTRKGEYVRSLAEHFMDGRLSSKFLTEGSVEDVSKALIDVRGIGQWTVDMFLIFTLRRADILPVGDLGVQKGLLKWVLSAYAKDESPDITPPDSSDINQPADGSSIVPAPPIIANTSEIQPPSPGKTAKGKSKDTEESRLKEALRASLHACPEGYDPTQVYPLAEAGPEGEKLSVSILKSRQAGKKLKGGMYLSPKEMEMLTAKWAPYRSLGTFFMWELLD